MLTDGSLTFTAVGNNSVSLNCTGKAGQGQICGAVDSPLLVKGSLLSPVAVTPAYAQGPTGHSKPGCVAASQNPSWALSTMYYVHQKGPGITSSNFILQAVNPAIGYQTGCMAGNPPEGNSTVMPLVCNGQEFGNYGSDRYHITTDAVFDTATFRFTMNQTWYCDDVDEGKP